MKRRPFTYLMLLYCANFLAQRDTFKLNEITVSDFRSKITAQNFQETKTDSATKNNFLTGNVAQMLLQQNICFVKSYGPANIASLSIRGSSASQTAVLWNGMNINNAMLGMNDISLLPVGLFNSISLQKGALSGYWGSGATAGVLNLQSSAQNDPGFAAAFSTTYSSLQNIANWVSVNFSSGRWSSATRILADVSKNQYNYFSSDTTIVKQTHAQTTQYALMQDLGYRINSKQQMGMHIWAQDAQRQIPYTLPGLKQDAFQHDKIFRSMLDWKLNQNKYSLLAKTAFFNEALIYTNNSYSVFSNSVFKTFMADVEGQFYLPKGFTITGGSSNSVSIASTQDYDKRHQISRMALYENISWKKNKIQAGIYLREELFNFNTFVPTTGFTSSVNILKALTCKINAGTVYRYPTLNDLYWNPGGNLDLKPERGHSEEISLKWSRQIKKISFSLNGTIFSRNIRDCIIWLPGKNGIWSPQNVLQVWSRGGETNTEITFRNKNVRSFLTIITNYVLSGRTQTRMQNDASVNRQMPYVPMYSGSAVFSLEYKNWMLRIAYVYTGYRYLTSDNYNYLIPYTILDARISRTFSFKNILLSIFAEGNNLLNENYQSVTQYPMPLRNFKTGIILQYQTGQKIK